MDGDALEQVELAVAHGRYRDARRLATDLLAHLQDPEERLRCRIALEHARMRMGTVDVDSAEAVARDAEGTPWHGRALDMLGSVLFQSRRLDQAERCFSQAIEWARAHEDSHLAWLASGGLGLIRRQRRDLDGALRVFDEATEGLEALGDVYHAGMFASMAADVLRWQGRYEETLKLIQRTLIRAQPFELLAAELYRLEASVRAQLGQTERAAEALQEALVCVGPHPGVVRGRILNDLADLARAQGRLGEARAYLERALERRPPEYAPITRLNLAMVELLEGRKHQAKAAVAPVLETSPYSWYRLYAHAVLVTAEDDADAVDRHLQALEMATVHGTLIERDLYELYQRAADDWTGRDPRRAARLRMLQHVQAVGLDEDVDGVERALVALRKAGAPIPLGPLDLQDLVQAGGMGQVWRGTVRGTRLEVAAKVLASERASDAQVATSLRRELRAVARLDHAHIVPTVDHGVVSRAVSVMSGGALSEGTPWLATQWAGGGTLASWCGRRGYGAVRAALLQVLEALGAAHAEGLLHLDVKPENVLVASEDPLTLWLADFGVARALDAGGDGTVAGTPAYMAPEQCRGAVGRYGPWTDLYALGATAFALVQGAPPFQEGDARELMQQQISRPAPPLAPRVAVPAGFEAWCRRLLAKDPCARFRYAADAAAALAALGDAPAGSVGATLPAAAPMASDTFVLDAWMEPAEGNIEESNGELGPAAPMAAELPPDRVPPTVPELAWAARRLLTLRRVPLVGRQRERRALWSALREAEGGARVIRLDAAPGAGRTSLLRWFARVAVQTGAARVLWVRSGEGGDPWREALAGLLRVGQVPNQGWDRQLPRQIELHVGAGVLAPDDGALIGRLLTDGPGAGLDPVPLVLRVVQAMARERRVLVCLDGPQPEADWLVERLREATPAVPVLVVGMAEDLVERPGREELALGPLLDAEIGELVSALVPLTPELYAEVVRAAAGEPATAVWTVRGWLSGRELVATPEGLALQDGTLFPQTPVEAVGRMLEPLLAERPEYWRQVEVLAALGDEVGGERWRRACEEAGVAFAPELADRLVARGLLEEREARYAFGDRWVRRTVLDRMGG